MRIEIEFAFFGYNHARRIWRHDDGFGQMVRGFQFRLRPVFVAVLWRVK